MKPNFMKIAAAAAMAAGMAFAQTTPAPASPKAPATRPFGRRAFGHGQMMQALNLTDAQKAQAKTIFQTARQNSQPVMDQLKQNRQALSAAIKANDTAQIQQLSATQGKLRGELLANRSSAMAQFYQILTPAQRTKVDQMQEQARTRMQQRFERQQQRRSNSNGE
jgi:periplasmic protein CpxP/Spy